MQRYTTFTIYISSFIQTFLRTCQVSATEIDTGNKRKPKALSSLKEFEEIAQHWDVKNDMTGRTVSTNPTEKVKRLLRGGSWILFTRTNCR